MVFSHSFIGVPTTYLVLKNTKKKHIKFSLKEENILWFVGIVSAILPDFDLLYVLFNSGLKHRYFISHSILPYFIIFILIFIYSYLNKRQSMYIKTLSYVFFLGVCSHLIIDLLVGGIVLFAPITYNIWGYELFRNTSDNVSWITKYIFSWYMVFEILSFFPYFLIQKKVKNTIATYLPLFFFGSAILAFLYFVFI